MNVQPKTVPSDIQAQAGKPLSSGEIWENAKGLRAFLQSHSDAIEDARRLTPEVVSAMKEAGLFRLIMPKIWGGPELTSMEQVEVIEEVSRGDASAGWCLMIGCDSGLYSGFMEDSAARTLYPRLDMVQAGWVHPVGQAHEVDGGYSVKKAQWAFCSGSTHTDNIAAGCIVHSGGEPKLNEAGLPEWRIMVAPVDQWEIKDTWHTTGLRGTASNDYTIKGEELFVPREHSFTFREPHRDGPLWNAPDALLRKMSGIPLGTARAAIDFATDLLKDKVEMPSGLPYKSLPRVKTAIAEAEMKLGAARSYVFSSLENQWRKLERGEALTEKDRADVWLSRLNAFQSARDVVQQVYDTVGGSAVYAQKGPLDRAMRDTMTMCQHIAGQHKGAETVGSLLLGDDSAHIISLL